MGINFMHYYSLGLKFPETFGKQVAVQHVVVDSSSSTLIDLIIKATLREMGRGWQKAFTSARRLINEHL